MKVNSVIEDEDVIKKILKHLGLWEVKARPPPKATAIPPDFHIDYSDSQVSPCEDYLFQDPEYPIWNLKKSLIGTHYDGSRIKQERSESSQQYDRYR